MRREEKTATEYFKAKGFDNITYEPKGNRPPDLLLNNEIAVEVRRLNQFLGTKPIEDIQSKLEPQLLKMLNNYGNGDHTHTLLLIS